MSAHPWSALAKFGAFAVVMAMVTAALFAMFGDYRSADTVSYSAVFLNVSHLHAGETVRFDGVRVGTVTALTLQPDKTVVVDFDVDRGLSLTDGTHAEVRYLNLVGDHYLDLVDEPASTRLLPAGSRIPPQRTAPALDLDELLGGLKPVIQGLNPRDVNQLSAALIQIFQGQGDTVASLTEQTASFTNALADKSHTVQQLIDTLQTTLATVARQGDQFSGGIDKIQRLVTELAADREPIGAAIDSLSAGTNSLAGLLTQARPPLAATVDQLSKLAPALDAKRDRLGTVLAKSPENYRKLVRIGAYGSFINYYICYLDVRVTDLQDKTAVFHAFRQDGGRCSEP
ncbi:mammalian cell entry protein [Mycolicibacterium madagascariense]|uniref:Mammalian cell entry protein n=1 Tax=Mycolicibacterium madagascariense TaxID=212765 RepID=A0A7I7X8L3_9MYCO|nr:MlaD family protein [Mycolicibacterium madagascariense]MCV7014163.1 MCE family protein [Mycolicibacterium madagascariense]BBZ25772.1 mammalian cell entry protein [Mycolicibacterium madagascariense]